MSTRPEFEERLKALPDHPGVYIYKDQKGDILYVGKSVSLRQRVRSYFQSSEGLSQKTRELVTCIADFEVILTDNELEALVLENSLIKEHRPRYNIRLRDDKTYPFIKVTLNEQWPRVLKTRRVEDDGARYFGPFSDAGAVKRTLRLLDRLFPYCSRGRVVNGKQERPCLNYYIGRCLGACAGRADPDEYMESIQQVILFLEGKGDHVTQRLREQMNQAAEALEFERAARLRDQLHDIQQVLERQKVVLAQESDEDVIAFARDDGNACVQVFFIRRGRLIGSEHFLMQGAEEEKETRVMASFLTQFYENATLVPGTILLQHEIEEWGVIEEWLRRKRGSRVTLRVPRRGQKRQLMEMVARNAVQTLEQLRLKWLSDQQRQAGALAELRDALDLTGLPRRIEGYDISTLQGTAPVGSMVVFEDGVPQSGKYRRFRIQSVTGQDDYAMLAEVLGRRFRRAAEEEGVGGEWGSLPDLVLIDGGKGQVGAARKVLQEAGLEIPMIGLAKREEEIFIPGRPHPLCLPRDSIGLHLLQQVRDEAHRFAISYHRQRRRKKGLRSQIEDVPGIGPRRRKSLLKHFGSIAAMRQASVEELAAVPGMNKRVAEQLKDWLG
ncbi:MAG: excinuclease ABC subunit UvrC [Chloroflexia bacterium]|nr:excinuclease ABC subunit UvrC [Chloroflexia bacterium]